MRVHLRISGNGGIIRQKVHPQSRALPTHAEQARVSRPAPGVQSLLQMQQQHGNRYVQRVLVPTRKGKGETTSYALETAYPTSSIQLKPASSIDIKTVEWEKGVALAEKMARKKATRNKAKTYYQALIVRAAQKVTAPSPLVDKKPTAGDIRWTWSKSSEWSATTDPGRVDNSPADYWKWLRFNPSAVQKEEAWTVSAILHELDHAAHAKALYEKWRKAGSSGKWDDFWVAHQKRWTEKQITVGASAGLIGALAGLPSKIRPSVIEFRAYASQFVHFFHKYSLEKQGFIAKAMILFYPLKKQNVKEKISDPSLDVATVRKQILDYFNSPPVGSKEQQKIIRIRIASEFEAALVLFRPSDDHQQIRKDFRDIFDYKYSREDRRDARKRYKSQK